MGEGRPCLPDLLTAMRDPETDDVIDDDSGEWCPECFSDDVIELETGELRCCECGIVSDY